jgi:hypothetical protein
LEALGLRSETRSAADPPLSTSPAPAEEEETFLVLLVPRLNKVTEVLTAVEVLYSAKMSIRRLKPTPKAMIMPRF